MQLREKEVPIKTRVGSISSLAKLELQNNNNLISWYGRTLNFHSNKVQKVVVIKVMRKSVSYPRLRNPPLPLCHAIPWQHTESARLPPSRAPESCHYMQSWWLSRNHSLVPMFKFMFAIQITPTATLITSNRVASIIKELIEITLSRGRCSLIANLNASFLCHKYDTENNTPNVLEWPRSFVCSFCGLADLINSLQPQVSVLLLWRAVDQCHLLYPG